MLATMVRPGDQNAQGKIGKASPAVYTYISGPEVDQGQGSVNTSPTWLCPSWCGASRMSDVAENRELL